MKDNINLRDDFDGHHGDISFFRANKLPKGAKFHGKFKEFVAQEGETTGHMHRIKSEQEFDVYKLIEAGEKGETIERWVYLLNAPAEISHEEHGTRVIQPGVLEQRQEMEEDPWTDEVIKVVD